MSEMCLRSERDSNPKFPRPKDMRPLASADPALKYPCSVSRIPDDGDGDSFRNAGNPFRLDTPVCLR
jgi:hypothetical protein